MSEEEQTFYVSPIADPIASDALRKKILKITRKLLKEKQVKRGVKEVVKALRKNMKGIVILAGDVSPVDVISHIPILCEQKGIPYIYVRSRMELGTAAQTKRPTSVVLLLESALEGDNAEKYQSLFDKIKSKNKYLAE